MATMELWATLMFAALRVDGKELKVSMVRVVKEYEDVFPKDLLSFPPEREVVWY